MRMLARVLALVCMCALFACAAPTPTPRPQTPISTRPLPEDAARNALAQLLSELDYDLAHAENLLTFMASAPQVRDGSASDCSAYVTSLARANPQYTHLAATSSNGVILCDSTPRTRSVSVADRLYYSRALTEHKFVVGEYIIGRVTVAPSLGLAAPIMGDSADLRGIVIAPLRLGWLAQRVADISIPVTGEIVILDSYGNILLRDPDATDWQGKNIAETELGNAMLSQIRGSSDLRGADGETRYYLYDSPRLSQDRLLIAVGIKK